MILQVIQISDDEDVTERNYTDRQLSHICVQHETAS